MIAQGGEFPAPDSLHGSFLRSRSLVTPLIVQAAHWLCFGCHAKMFRLRTDVPGANPTHAAFQVQPPTPTMAMGMTPMVGMPMGMIQPEPVQAPPLRPLKFIGMSGDGQPVYKHRPNLCSNNLCPNLCPNLCSRTSSGTPPQQPPDPDSSRIL